MDYKRYLKIAIDICNFVIACNLTSSQLSFSHPTENFYVSPFYLFENEHFSSPSIVGGASLLLPIDELYHIALLEDPE